MSIFRNFGNLSSGEEMKNNRSVDVVIYDLHETGMEAIWGHFIRCVGKQIKITVVSGLPISDVERRLSQLSIPLGVVRVFSGTDLRKSLELAMASMHVPPGRVCYVGNSSGARIASDMHIGVIKEVSELVRNPARTPLKRRVGA